MTMPDNDAADRPRVMFEDIARAPQGDEREGLIRGMVSDMSLREKISQMSGSMNLLDLGLMVVDYGLKTYDSGANKRLGIPALKFTDGPRGICLGRSTCFPVAMARAATWDVELQERVGSAIGIEARSQGANFFGGVCINVPRHPGWGRAQETFGEDPYLLGEMGAATLEGVHRHVMACIKHYACNSMEEARFYVDVLIDQRTLREVYLPHFKRCVDAGAAVVMSAYNQVNGEFCGHNSHLLRDILKEDWGFDGFVVSDFAYGVRDGVKGALGGLDVEMPYRWRYGPGFKGKVTSGKVPESVLDEAVTRVLRQKARFACVGEEGAYGRNEVASERHTALALEVARKSIVLLKNEGGVLPLDRERVKRLAVIGPLADRSNIGDMGSSRVNPPYVVTPLTGIRKLAAGSTQVIYERGRNVAAAREAARSCDAAVVVVGLTRQDEGEFMPVIHTGGDREDLTLPRKQAELIRAVAAECEVCIVVLQGGSAVLTSPWLGKVDALLMAWYGGMEGGNAIAEVLFGDVNPSGKLPITFPASNDQNPAFDKKARSARYDYYHGYCLFNEKGMKPAFAFGFGLSYTSFDYLDLRLSADSMGPDGSLRAEIEVKNVGELPGEEVVQLYLGCGASRFDRPVRVLKRFAKLALEPGETGVASFELGADDTACWDESAGGWVIEDTDFYLYAGSSSREEDLPLSAKFTIT
jgi:beta-glucosidase